MYSDPEKKALAQDTEESSGALSPAALHKGLKLTDPRLVGPPPQ